MECTSCTTEQKKSINCHDCQNFDDYVNKQTNVEFLKEVKKYLIKQKPVLDESIEGKIADFLVDKVGTMKCFYTFIVLATVPLLVPALMPMLGYISSGYLQLILLPLIMVAGNRSAEIIKLKEEREWKINLVSDKIDELMDDELLGLEREDHLCECSE